MILDDIADYTRTRVAEQKKQRSLEEIKKEAQACKNTGEFPFEEAMKQKGISFICEVKRASPSKGIIAEEFPYVDIAREYEDAGASAISVLTEPKYFKGQNRYLEQIVKEVNIPVLRKDFTVDEYQIYEAKTLGASAVLLICAILDTNTIRQYIQLAHSLSLSALVEAHTQEEVLSAIEAGARLIGVNNRNLQTFKVDITTSRKLRKFVPEDIIYISESGITTPEDIAALKASNVDGVLIGEILMKSVDKRAELMRLKGEGSDDEG